MHNRRISHLSRQKCLRQHHNYVPKWVSPEGQWSVKIFDLASWIIQVQWNAVNPQSTYHQSVLAKMLVMKLLPPPTIEHPLSMNNLCGGSASYSAMNCVGLFLNWVLWCQSFQYVLVYNCTNMHAMSHRSEFCTCSSGVDIYEPAFCFTIMLLSAISQVGLHSFLIPTTMSDLKSHNTLLLEAMISCKNEDVFIHDLSDLTLQIIFDIWWASMNVGSSLPIASNNSRQVSSWRLYFHCGIKETGHPGITCIICHQLLRHPSEHGTSSAGKHLLAKAYIAKLNYSIEW